MILAEDIATFKGLHSSRTALAFSYSSFVFLAYSTGPTAESSGFGVCAVATTSNGRCYCTKVYTVHAHISEPLAGAKVVQMYASHIADSVEPGDGRGKWKAPSRSESSSTSQIVYRRR